MRAGKSPCLSQSPFTRRIRKIYKNLRPISRRWEGEENRRRKKDSKVYRKLGNTGDQSGTRSKTALFVERMGLEERKR